MEGGVGGGGMWGEPFSSSPKKRLGTMFRWGKGKPRQVRDEDGEE